MNIGEIITRGMKAHRPKPLTYRELAEKSGVSVSGVYSMATNKHPPQTDTLSAVLRVFGLELCIRRIKK